MTELLTRPERPVTSRESGILGLYTAVMVAVGAAAVGLVVVTALVLVAWGADSGGNISALTALRAACQAWLLAHHSPIGTPSGTVALVPIGLLALPAGLLTRAGLMLGRANAPMGVAEAARLTVALAATYGVIAAGLSFGTGAPAARVGSLSAVLGAVLVALTAGGLGVLHGAELTGTVLARMPAGTAPVLRAAAVAIAVLLAVGAALVGAALAVHGGQLVRISSSLGSGIVGGVMVLLLCLLYAPNAVICGVSYVVGPGFAVGGGTSVTAFHAHLGPVPAFPLLAALPAGTRPSLLVTVVVVTPVFAAVLAGAVIGRAGGGSRTVTRRALVCAVLCGLLLAGLAALAGGPLGAGRLDEVGPSPWQVGAAGGAEMAVFGLIAAWWVGRGTEPVAVLTSTVTIALPEKPEPATDEVPEDDEDADSAAEEAADPDEEGEPPAS